ncbi:MAG: hypothetical protein ACM3JB_07505 [Acidobacteriaceae bacterium]
MTRTFEVHLPLEELHFRKVRFAVELLDTVTLERVTEGVNVVAEGIQGGPVVNRSGLFVWLQSHVGDLQRLIIDPRLLPYERVTLAWPDVKIPLTTIELVPNASYSFGVGTTCLRGMLIERRVIPPESPAPVPSAEIRLSWLDSDGVWQNASNISHTDENGDFASILRLAPDQVPLVDDVDRVTVRLAFTRGQGTPRSSNDLKILQGRIADPSTFDGGSEALTFIWDELQP